MSSPTPVRLNYSLSNDESNNESLPCHEAWRERLKLRSPCPPSDFTSTLCALPSESNAISTEFSPKAIFSFGILTDIQYAPIPDGHSYGGTPRYYRHALTATEHAARHFEEEKVDCVINLGDIVDGKCQNVEKWGGGTEEDGRNRDRSDYVGGETKNACPGHDEVDDVLKALSIYRNGRILHTYGNHELYNLSRKDLGRKLSIPFTLEPTGDLVGYYTHSVQHCYKSVKDDQLRHHKLRFLIIDSYDISILDRCSSTSAKRHRAEQLLAQYNPNFPEEENSPQGMEGFNKRFVAFNGAVDTPQLQWLQKSLQQSKENNEKVIILSHQPIHPGSSGPICLMWNYDEVLAILRQYPCTIIASFSGHAHKGGYERDAESGIHFRTLEAVLESPDPIRTYGFVDVLEDRLIVRGLGNCQSDEYDFDHMS